MPIYKLTPIDLEHIDWRASSHQGPCIVRASDKRRAGLAAVLAFMQAVEVVPGTLTVNPWNQADKVRTEFLTDHGYNEEGPEVVLAPPGDHPELEDTSQ